MAIHLPFMLVADDDEDDCFLFSQAIKEINPAIGIALVGSGLAALAILQNDILSPPDFIFLDMNMPAMNGVECLARIKKIPLAVNIPVIVYSTGMDTALEKKLLAAGAFACFSKPASAQELTATIRRLCRL